MSKVSNTQRKDVEIFKHTSAVLVTGSLGVEQRGFVETYVTITK